MTEAAAACVRHSAQKRPRMVQVITILDNLNLFCVHQKPPSTYFSK